MTADISEDEASSLFDALRKRHVRTDDRSISGRRVREARPMNHRRRVKSDRTVQVNLKFEPAFKKLMQAVAEQRNVTMTELIEHAVNAYVSNGGAE
jgi:hypothetical protein